MAAHSEIGGKNAVSGTRARTILVAVDANDGREAIGFWLGQAGFDVLQASNATELEQQIAQRPDVVLLDTELPGRTGFELANRLKADPATANVPVIHLARGFTTGPTLWAHVVRGNTRRNVKLGAVKGACGGLKARKRLLPRNAPVGVYTLQFDTFRRYDGREKNRPVRDRYTITVTRF